MKYIFVDFEMNPVAKEFKEQKKICRGEIIEIGAVLLGETYEEEARFKQLVKPKYNKKIYKKYTSLTGITTEMVKDAPEFSEALDIFADWSEKLSGGCYEIYAWSENDLAQLKSEMRLKQIPTTERLQYMVDHWIDFQKIFTQLLNLEKPMSLSTAVELTANLFEGKQHDALWDAKNTANIFALSRNEALFKEQMKVVLDALKPERPHTFSMGDMFSPEMLSKMGMK